MSSNIVLNQWQFWLLTLLAFYGVTQLLLLPLLQKLIYRRSRKREHTLSEELQFGLSSYALANRELWLDRVIGDSEVQQAINEWAEYKQQSIIDTRHEARSYADEIVPRFNALLYFKFGYWMARSFLRLFYWIQVGFSAQKTYGDIPKDSTVIMVSNHRSNFDPFLLIYLTSKTAPVSYSAGEWALVTPFRQLLHAIGFYIVRRTAADNKLYHRVLERYVFLATSNTMPQGMFIEGGLSKDGSMQPLKLGLLNYLCKAYDKNHCKDIVFIPCALNYDKIPEDKTLIQHQDEGFTEKSRLYSLLSFLKFFITVATYIMPRPQKPFGYACVNFGKPISLRHWQQHRDIDLHQLEKNDRRAFIGELGDELAQEIRNLLPILPTNLLATVLQTVDDHGITELKLKYKATELIEQLRSANKPLFLPNNDGNYALSQGIYILLRCNIIKPTGDGRFIIVEEQRKLLDYYSNTITPLLS